MGYHLVFTLNISIGPLIKYLKSFLSTKLQSKPPRTFPVKTAAGVLGELAAMENGLTNTMEPQNTNSSFQKYGGTFSQL